MSFALLLKFGKGKARKEFGRQAEARRVSAAGAQRIVPLVMKGPSTVSTHRGLSPHQFTPMSGAHKAPAPNRRPCFPLGGSAEFDYRFALHLPP